jgi:hypothetical protein
MTERRNAGTDSRRANAIQANSQGEALKPCYRRGGLNELLCAADATHYAAGRIFSFSISLTN